MAHAASHSRVPVRERETRRAVVERSRRPGRNWMARGALRRRRREACRNMVRNVAADARRAIKRRRVAPVTVRGIQGVVVVDVAGRAGRRRGRHVRAHQSEACDAVIERRGIPAFGRVAVRAVCRGERGTRGRVHGSVRLLPGRQVALRISAVRRRNLQCVIVVDVAGGTRNVGVSIREQESRGAVIEFSVRPFGDGMATRARRRGAWESRSDMVGHAVADGRGALPCELVTAKAIR